MKINQKRARHIYCLVIIMLILWGLPVLATTITDSASLLSPVTVTPATIASSNSDSCAYYAQDTYANTELPSRTSPVYFNGMTNNGAVGLPNYPIVNPGNILNLAWTSGVNSPLALPVTCSGLYRYYFTLQLEATSSNSSSEIRVCVQTTDGRYVIYGFCPANVNNPFVFTFNPVCNSGDYCGKMIYTFTGTAFLEAGQTVRPPNVYSQNAAVAITGGEFILFYVGPGTLNNPGPG